MRAVASLIAVAALIQSSGALGSETLYCSTTLQGYKICSGPSGL